MQLGFARLQAQVRSRQLNFQYKKKREAALVLQTHVRGYVARKEWKRKRKAVILLQAHTRGILARKALEKMKRDVSSPSSGPPCAADAALTQQSTKFSLIQLRA